MKQKRVISSKRTKIFNNNIEKTFFKYCLKTLSKNHLLKIVSILGFLSVIILPSIIINKNSNISFFEWSYIISLVPFITSILFIGISTIILFSKTKTNNVDLYLSITPISDKKTVYIKQFSIFIMSLHIIIAVSILSIILIIKGVDPLMAISLLLAIIASLFVMNLFWIVIFSWIAIYLSYAIGLSIITSLAVIIPSSSLLPPILLKSNSTSTEFNVQKYKENLVKLYSLDDTGSVVDRSFAIYENPNAPETQNISLKKGSYSRKLLPFSSILGFTSSIVNLASENILNDSELASINTDFSISNITGEEHNIPLLFNQRDFVIAEINEKTVLDFDSKSNLFDAINTKLLENNFIKARIHDLNFWDLEKNELKNRNIWDKNISKEIKEIIAYISGVNTSDNFLYDLFSNNVISDRYLDGIYTYFKNKYSNEFAEFIKYIWTDENVKLNIYSYDNLGFKVHTNIHPSLMSYNELAPANKYDIEYVKKYLFRPVMTNNNFSIQLLNDNLVYEDINSIPNAFGVDLKNETEFNNYIDAHNTINNLRDTIKRASTTISGKAHQVYFQNNVQNTLKLNRAIDFESHNKYPFTIAYIGLFMLITIIGQKRIINKVEKGDMKLWN